MPMQSEDYLMILCYMLFFLTFLIVILLLLGDIRVVLEEQYGHLLIYSRRKVVYLR